MIAADFSRVNAFFTLLFASYDICLNQASSKPDILGEARRNLGEASIFWFTLVIIWFVATIILF